MNEFYELYIEMTFCLVSADLLSNYVSKLCWHKLKGANDAIFCLNQLANWACY